MVKGPILSSVIGQILVQRIISRRILFIESGPGFDLKRSLNRCFIIWTNSCKVSAGLYQNKDKAIKLTRILSASKIFQFFATIFFLVAAKPSSCGGVVVVVGVDVVVGVSVE